MEEHIQTVEARNAAGETVALHVFQKRVDVGRYSDPNATAGGMKRIVTDDGKSVNRLAKGRYEIVATGEILTSDSSDAP